MTPFSRHGPGRKRALIVNCYVDETRRPVGRSYKVPRSLGPVFLAGALEPDLWDIRLHDETFHGPLEDEALLGWPDLLVMTGLVTSLDRMRHLTAYARTRNPAVVVVAGGHVVRAFPRFCERFLDYACRGDVEELTSVITEAFGAAYASDGWAWRYDLCHWFGGTGYAESSRYCNFACSFCTLTGEGRPYRPHPPERVRAQVESLGRRRYTVFLDNNFYGSDRASFRDRVEVAGALRDEGWYRGWTALVTSDFFADPDNVPLVLEAGCAALFTGVESFDVEWTARQNKRQNAVTSQVGAIRAVLDQGLVFLYGLILDLTTRSIADVRRELEMIIDCPEITLPSYVSLPVPIPGTPFFHACRESGLILPDTKVRDLDATTISLRTRDSLDAAARFVRDLQSMAGYRPRILRHSAAFWHRYRTTLSRDQMVMALANAALLVAPLWATGPRASLRRPVAPRTFVSSTEVPDAFYRPAFRVDSRYESYFEPAMLTDGTGEISAELAPDLLASRTPPAAIERRAPRAAGAG